MDPREPLEMLGEPDPTAVDRVWRRFQRTRAQERRARPRRIAFGVVALAAAGLAVAAVWQRPEKAHTVDLTAAVTPAEHDWSEQISLQVLGHGVMTGTGKRAEIAWDSGTVRAEVEPHAGVELAVVTPEARVDVVGTVFSVRRDALGSTVGVDRGRVRVTCADGWTGEVGGGDASHTCLPTSAAGLLARAEALLDAGAADAVILDTLDRGVVTAGTGSPIGGELLVLRMREHAEAGRVDDALADATTYTSRPDASRLAEVRRFAGWLALSERGCAAAMPWLTELHRAGSLPETVMLAECVAADDPARARTLLLTALPSLDAEWSDRAVRDLAALPVETR